MTPRARVSGRQRGDRRVGAPELEGADRLEGLGLEERGALRAVRRRRAASVVATPRRRRGRRSDAAEVDERRPSSRSAVRRHRGRGRRALALDAVGGPRQRLEASCGDRLAAADARPVRPGVEPRERLLDELELRDRPGRGGRGRVAGRRPGWPPRPATRRSSARARRSPRRPPRARRARSATSAARAMSMVGASIARMVRGSARRAAPRAPRGRYTPGTYTRGVDHGHRDRSRLRHGGRHDHQSASRSSTTGRPTGSAARAACSSSRTTPRSTCARPRPVDVAPGLIGQITRS